MPENYLPRDELRATVEAARELGPEYESALVESFVDKVDAAIAARVHSEVNARLGPSPPPPPPAKSGNEALWTALISMGLGIPLTGIAAGTSGTIGLLVSWTGIVLINFAAAINRRR
ncbi:hypothetical protein [Streptosporangium sp. KLBMP 9127]|nr:hypothetical protein [Streptosporangium sp. KLBMP 9127]